MSTTSFQNGTDSERVMPKDAPPLSAAPSAAYTAAVSAVKELTGKLSLEGSTTAGHRVLKEIIRLQNVLVAAEHTVLAHLAQTELEAVVQQARATGKKAPSTNPEDVFHGQNISYRALHNTLATTLGRTVSQTRKHLRNATYFVGPLQETLAALWRGELTAVQAGHIAEQHFILRTTPIITDHGHFETPDAITQELESALLDKAAEHSGASFGALARTLREQKHPDTLEAAREKAKQERFVSITAQADGMARIFGILPIKELGKLDQLLDARTRSILNRPTDKAGRTRSQIKADEFLKLLPAVTNKSGTASTGIGSDTFDHNSAGEAQILNEATSMTATTSSNYHVLVTIPVELFLAAGGHLPRDVVTRLNSLAPAPQLVGYGPLSPQEALDIAAATTTWETLLTHPVSGEMLALGRKRYRPTAQLRRALQARDVICRIPGCTTPATMCQVDHVTENQHGGTSDATNLINLCFHHHQLKTAGKWQIQHTTDPPDGSLRITLSDGTIKIVPPPSGFRGDLGQLQRNRPTQNPIF